MVKNVEIWNENPTCTRTKEYYCPKTLLAKGKQENLPGAHKKNRNLSDLVKEKEGLFLTCSSLYKEATHPYSIKSP